MAEPHNKFVEVIKIWQNGLSVYPVAIILYDSNWGNAAEFHFVRAISKILPTADIYLYLLQELKYS